MKKQSFLAGAIALTISGVICKILGALYKIPLANILGTQGMGIYYIIFPVFAFLLTFVSSNFTISISRSISQSTADGNESLTFYIFKSSLFLLIFLGGIMTLLLIIFSKLIANWQGIKDAFFCYIIIAPSILFVSVQSVFRGLFQGLKNMNPTAISQVISQFLKIVVGFILASILHQKNVYLGTMGVFFAITLSEMVGCIYFIIYYFLFKKKYDFGKGICSTNYSMYILMKEVFRKAVPFTLSSIFLPLALMVDSFLIVWILKSMGFSGEFATELIGINSGIVSTLINLPSTLSVSICMSIIPYISYAFLRGDYDSIKAKASLSFKVTMLLALPCFFTFTLFSPLVITLLYGNSLKSIYVIRLSSTLLSMASINVFYLAVLQLSTALLQAMNKAYIPVIGLSIGVFCKIIFEVIFISNPYFNIAGAIVSNAVCFFVASIINVVNLRKVIVFTSSLSKTILYPLLSSSIMTFVIFCTYKLFLLFSSSTLSIICAFLVGLVVYILLIFSLKTFTKEEQKALFILKTKKER